MTAVVEKERVVFMRGRNQDFTQEEYDRINAEYHAAEKRGDEAAMIRILPQIPMSPRVIRAVAKVYGKDFILEADYDLTEANIAYGEGWLDELE